CRWPRAVLTVSLCHKPTRSARIVNTQSRIRAPKTESILDYPPAAFNAAIPLDNADRNELTCASFSSPVRAIAARKFSKTWIPSFKPDALRIWPAACRNKAPVFCNADCLPNAVPQMLNALEKQLSNNLPLPCDLHCAKSLSSVPPKEANALLE